MSKYFKFIILFSFILLLTNCAKRGAITGGLKDTLAPELRISIPKNFSTNFKNKEIKLTFDEYVLLKDINKQLVISPPMKYMPIILPTNASKYITIKILDTLKENTTYSFNFGQSIKDNNEGNPINQFKYIFSTGNQIDSLTLNGKIKDAYKKEADNFVSVMLYEINELFKDSVIYKENPRYITNTLDSLTTFKLENLKAGNYMLVALKDKNSNNKYNPKEDKIGFIKQIITIPNDSIYEIELFKENLKFKAFKPTQESGNKLFMGYEGNIDSKKSIPEINLKNFNEKISSIITKYPKKDSLQIWFKPIKTDTLNLSVAKNNYKADFRFKFKDQKKDTLKISAVQNGNIGFNERFALETSTPLVKFDLSKIALTNKDSTAVKYSTEYDDFNQKYYIDFKKEELEKYKITLLPGALSDFYDKINDTLTYTVTTKSIADVGNLKIKLQNVKRFPIIIELTNNSGETIETKYSEKETDIDFNLIDPSIYTIRLIYDDTKNNQYDSGNFLEKRYSEEVVYFSKEIDVRANWDVEQVFDVSLPYIPEPKKKPVKNKSSF